MLSDLIGETERTASPLDVWALMQPTITTLKVGMLDSYTDLGFVPQTPSLSIAKTTSK